MTLNVIDQSQFKNKLGAGKAVVVDFYADWCAPCRALAPALEALADEFTEIEFVKVDVDADPELAQSYDILAMPTVVHFAADGTEVARSRGAVPGPVLKTNLGL